MLVLASELMKTHIWLPPQDYTKALGTTFVYRNGSSRDQKNKREAAPTSSLVTITKQTPSQAGGPKKPSRFGQFASFHSFQSCQLQHNSHSSTSPKTPE